MFNKSLSDLIADESGATTVEYVVLAGVGSALALGVGTLVSSATAGLLNGINGNVSSSFAPQTLGTN